MKLSKKRTWAIDDGTPINQMRTYPEAQDRKRRSAGQKNVIFLSSFLSFLRFGQYSVSPAERKRKKDRKISEDFKLRNHLNIFLSPSSPK